MYYEVRGKGPLVVLVGAPMDARPFGPLAAAGARVVVGIGEASAGQICDRTSRALAAELGIEPTMFPGGHTGFAEDPSGFAGRLYSVLRAG